MLLRYNCVLLYNYGCIINRLNLGNFINHAMGATPLLFCQHTFDIIYTIGGRYTHIFGKTPKNNWFKVAYANDSVK